MRSASDRATGEIDRGRLLGDGYIDSATLSTIERCVRRWRAPGRRCSRRHRRCPPSPPAFVVVFAAPPVVPVWSDPVGPFSTFRAIGTGGGYRSVGAGPCRLRAVAAEQHEHKAGDGRQRHERHGGQHGHQRVAFLHRRVGRASGRDIRRRLVTLGRSCDLGRSALDGRRMRIGHNRRRVAGRTVAWGRVCVRWARRWRVARPGCRWQPSVR